MEIILHRGAQEIIAELEVDQETGEISAAFPLEILVQRNPIACGGYILHTQAQMKMVKAYIDGMQAKYKAAESRVERIKSSLKEVMQATGVTQLESPDATFKIKLHKERDKSVDVFDADQLPADYLREIPATFAPDKKLIEQAIKDGFEVPGARIVAKDRLEIR